ncbi:hypothetical protein HYALB_00008848 [Hymenoscyphus albidus]|uniref:Uncharacterized protein n=1 Tax=Hymenoscyphus albidus TaxID=595503 RepID=A0A9N9Q6Z1_9HELO|nr:hypothetical protein HYALB_00008848 [Hymenoscyphus albidus]
MGIPLLVRKHGFFRMSWLQSHEIPGPFSNCTPIFLNRACDPDDSGFGFANLVEWDKIIGTVLVVRQDKKPITAQQVEALCLFCCDYWAEHIEETLPAYDPDDDEYKLSGDENEERDNSDKDVIEKRVKLVHKEFIRNHINQEKFEEFFEQMKQKNVQEGDTAWADAVSPYTV